MTKAWKITISIIASVLVALFVTIIIYYFWPWNKNFFDVASQEFEIPGLDTKFTPQGLTKIADQNKYLISGYMSDESASRFYIIDGETNEVEKYFSLSVNGKKYNGHAGGVVSVGTTLWTVSSIDDTGYCFRFRLSDINNVENGGEVIIKDYFETYNGADFIFANNGTLWIGEFYREKSHETSDNHKITTRSGEVNPAIVYGFAIDETCKYGIYSQMPTKALSIRGLCQGIDMTSSGNFVLSTSYSISDSNIYYYKDVLNESSHSTFRFGLYDIPLWYLDNDSLINSIKAPSMSEELIVNNERVYILFESGCKKYKFYNRNRLNNVYSLSLNDLSK